jgi:hypothetical protein
VTRYADVVFLHSMGSVGHVVHLVHEMSTHYFSCSSGPGAVFINSTPGHNTSTLCFSIQWD